MDAVVEAAESALAVLVCTGVIVEDEEEEEGRRWFMG